MRDQPESILRLTFQYLLGLNVILHDIVFGWCTGTQLYSFATTHNNIFYIVLLVALKIRLLLNAF